MGLHLRGQTRIFWKRKAWRIGKVCYVAEMGVKLTEELYTASENEAVAFRKKHGFEPGADNVRADANTLKKSLGWDRAERKGNNEVTADPFR